MFAVVALSLESELSRWCKLLTGFTILHISNNSNEHFIFHKESILRLLESNEEFEGAKLGAPRMTTTCTFEFKVATLFSLQHEEFISVPLLFVFNCKHFCEWFLTSPLYLDPLNRRAIRRHRNILMAVNIVLNLLNISLGRFQFNSLAVERWLEPIRHLKNIPFF